MSLITLYFWWFSCWMYLIPFGLAIGGNKKPRSSFLYFNSKFYVIPAFHSWTYEKKFLWGITILVVAVFSNLALWVNSCVVKDQYYISTLLYHVTVKFFYNISLISTYFKDLKCLRNLRDLSKLCCWICLANIFRVFASVHDDWCANYFTISTYDKCQSYLPELSPTIFFGPPASAGKVLYNRVCPSIHLSIHSSIRPSAHPSVCL